MSKNFEKLQSLLSELFQLDQADLDFGIYRIMNQKRDEITRFLEKDLLPQVKTAFAQYHPADKKVLEEKLEEARQAARTAGFNPDQSPKVKELLEQISTISVDTEALENDVYSHLYSFFRRYYDSGDFISMRRYKEGVYAIPYEGEEVKLHWANADQYYIKTAEYFRDYAFKLPSGRLAHFKIVEADTEKDNVKTAEEKERRFILVDETPLLVEADALIMRFEYRAEAEKRKQDAINSQTVTDILANAPTDWAADLQTLAPSESNPRRTLLEKRLTDYTARNTFDYFIHKDLHGFLNRELDFYIKNEVMRLDDIESETAPRVEQYMSKIKVLRGVAHKIIAFLAQIEDFQKKLWLKKKFVVETNYCITLDRVPEELYPEIAANDAQREEWVRLFAIDEIKSDLLKPGYSIPLSVEFLKANPFLVLDTKFYDSRIVNSILSNFENIDQLIDGLLIRGENFQSLNMLRAKLQKEIRCIYIDPPYNTSASEIAYKNSYRHSSWMSFMHNRLEASKSLLLDDGVCIVAIDDTEMVELSQILDDLFVGFDRNMVVVNHHPAGAGLEGTNISTTHEYAIFMIPKNKKLLFGTKKENDTGEISMIRTGTADSNLRTGRPNSFYAILVDPKDSKVVGCEKPPVGKDYPLGKTKEGFTRIYPLGLDGTERVWRRSYESCISEIGNNNVVCKNNKSIYLLTDESEKHKPIFSNWTDTKYNAGVHGTNVLTAITGTSLFSYPKSIYNVMDSVNSATIKEKNANILDFFGGSGTTAHAVINLNREDGGNRKYNLIEINEYFDTVLKPRVQKIVYSKDWKDGKPVSREGSSHCFKYLRLESYEDTLNNLVLQRTQEQQLSLDQSSSFSESYMLSYMLDSESQQALLNVAAFAHPFAYQLNIATGTVGESKPTTIDLVETFNYLIGLRVQTMQTLRGYKVITGLTPDGERTLIIWRDLSEKSNADLEEFFRKQDYNPRDMEFDLIYVNGDNNLENLRRSDETWKVRLIEEEFLRRMFDTEGL